MTHMSHRSRCHISPRDGYGAPFVTHTMWSCAPQRPAVLSARQRYCSYGAGFQPTCRQPGYRRQVMDVADGAQDGRLPHGLARRPPPPRPTRRSALPRRVARAKALPDRVQAPPGLSSSTRSARSPPPGQPRRDFHGIRQGLNPPTHQPSPLVPLPHAGYA